MGFFSKLAAPIRKITSSVTPPAISNMLKTSTAIAIYPMAKVTGNPTLEKMLPSRAEAISGAKTAAAVAAVVGGGAMLMGQSVAAVPAGGMTATGTLSAADAAMMGVGGGVGGSVGAGSVAGAASVAGAVSPSIITVGGIGTGISTGVAAADAAIGMVATSEVSKALQPSPVIAPEPVQQQPEQKAGMSTGQKIGLGVSAALGIAALLR